MTSSGSSLNEILKAIYYDPTRPGGFASLEKLYQEAKKEKTNLKRCEVEDWLKAQITYTLHKPARRVFTRNRIIVSKPDEEWEADLVEMQEFARQNHSHRYILTVIDCFSKFAWVRALRSKNAKDVTTAFNSILAVRKPESLRTDKGKEFLNKDFQNLLKNNNIRYYNSQNSAIKCAIIERFNRTFKNRMFKFFTATGTRNFVDNINDLISGYNKSYHRSIKMAPADVNDNNRSQVFRNLYAKDSLRDVYVGNKNKTKLKIGDEVRMKYKLGPFDKAFYPNWTDRVYTISGIDRSNVITLHKVDGVEPTDHRKFYAHDLQHVKAEKYRIEKVLKRRRYKGELQYFVKWINYPSSANSWINASEITTL